MPNTCYDCKNKYSHDKFVNLLSGGVMKTTGNKYCTALKKHKKINKSDFYKRIPIWCPIKEKDDSKRQ